MTVHGRIALRTAKPTTNDSPLYIKVNMITRSMNQHPWGHGGGV